MAEAGPRYAVYFAPRAGCAHDRVGARWLGRDARSGSLLPQPAVPGIAPGRLGALTANARRYGLHATLKPPFRLHPFHDPARLDAALRALAGGLSPFGFRVGLAPLDGFLAWRPLDHETQLAAVAALCVRELDALRAPPSASELARRRQAGLTERQDALLARWGYPYVLDEFRFHLTLTDRLGGDEAAPIRAAVEQECRALADEALQFDALALFVQPEEGADFRHVRSYGFDGGVWSAPERAA